jgi:hypothetical protein
VFSVEPVTATKRVFIVFVFAKHFLSLLLVFFKFLSVDKVCKIWFKPGKRSFFEE